VILNPAPAQALPNSLLEKITILTPNESEASLLSGIEVTDLKTAELAGKKLLENGAQTVLITLGKEGVLRVESGRVDHFPAYEVVAVDTTAAGDTFNGALASAYAETGDLEYAIRFAIAAAALSVTSLGAQPSCPRRDAIEKRLND